MPSSRTNNSHKIGLIAVRAWEGYCFVEHRLYLIKPLSSDKETDRHEALPSRNRSTEVRFGLAPAT